MPHIFSYRDGDLYSHHTMDAMPEREKFAMHGHEWMEILYCINGSGSCLVEGIQYPLEPQDIFIFRPGEMHKIILDPEVPYERIVIHFIPELLSSVDPGHTLLRPFTDRPAGTHNRYSLADHPESSLRTAFSNYRFEQTPNVRLNLLSRLFLFLTHLEGHYQQAQLDAPAEGLPGQLVAYVNEHIFEDISIQSIADHFYRSRSQISRAFQQATGSGLWEYVIIKRLLAARALIRSGQPANSACTACGFSEYSSFYRAYRSHFGHSPREDAPK